MNPTNDLSETAKTVFFKAVWELVRMIPAGRVATYGQVAAQIPAPSGISPEGYQAFRARWVGQAMAACPEDVPWQRVVNTQGKISSREGAVTQRRLLTEEGVCFDERERIDLKRFGWQPNPPNAGQPALF